MTGRRARRNRGRQPGTIGRDARLGEVCLALATGRAEENVIEGAMVTTAT